MGHCGSLFCFWAHFFILKPQNCSQNGFETFLQARKHEITHKKVFDRSQERFEPFCERFHAPQCCAHTSVCCCVHEHKNPSFVMFRRGLQVFRSGASPPNRAVLVWCIILCGICQIMPVIQSHHMGLIRDLTHFTALTCVKFLLLWQWVC